MLPHGEGTAMALSVLIMMWLRVGVGGGGGSDMYVKQTWTKDAFHKSDCISVGWFVLVQHKLLVFPAKSVLNGSITKAG